jgi:beta-lactamase class A
MDGSSRVSFGSFRNRLATMTVVLAVLAMLFAPASAQPAGGVQWQAIDQSLSAIAPQSNLLVAEFRGSTCATIHGRNETSELAIASVFKLYVLGELARQVQLGDASWSDTIVLSDRLRSMPSGDYAYLPAGTSATVLELAQAMIWVSDNTATDHLIDYLGRENVEKAFAAYGHSDPGINLPLLMTRELFTIKMSQSADWMATYMAAPDAEQARMVADQIDPLLVNPTGGWGHWNGPTAIDGIEWFASASDLCRVTASLWAIGHQPGLQSVHAILTGNRGGITDTGAFPAAGYKGGYEAGVVNMTFVLERNDGRVFFVTAGYNTPRGMIDQSAGRGDLDKVFACIGAGTCTDPA